MLKLKYLAGIATILLCHLSWADGFPDDLRVVTGVSFGYSDFSFDEKLDHNISFPSVSVPIALTSGNWQVSANLQSTLQDADISEEEDVGKASRDDYDFTVGYRATQHWTLFAGYKYGKTSIQFTPRDSEDDDELMVTDESYKQSGPFIGVSYGWRFENAGSLNISVAYADLSATNNFSANTDDEDEEGESDEAIEFDDITGNVTGDTKGLSYSVSWTMPISSNLLFQTRLKLNDYQQDIDYQGTRFNDIDETFTSLHVGVAYVF